MNASKMISLKDVRQEIGVGKTTLYKYLKKLGITTTKQFGVAHISSSDFEKIKAHVGIQSVDTSEQAPNDGGRVRTRAGEQSGQGRTDDGVNSDEHGENDGERVRTTLNDPVNELEQELRNQIKELKDTNEARQEKIENLTRDVGRWEGMTKVLQKRVLELEAPKAAGSSGEYPVQDSREAIVLEPSPYAKASGDREELPRKAKKRKKGKGKKKQVILEQDPDKDEGRGKKKGKGKKGKKGFLKSVGDFFGGKKKKKGKS